MTIPRPPQNERSNQNEEHSALPPSSLYHWMCDNIVCHLYTTKILHWKQNWFWFFLPWEAFPTLKSSVPSLAHHSQVCSCNAAEPIQQGVPASQRTNLLSSHHLPSKHLASQKTGQTLKQQKMAQTGSVWITGKQRLAQRRRHQEQKKVPQISPLAS